MRDPICLKHVDCIPNSEHCNHLTSGVIHCFYSSHRHEFSGLLFEESSYRLVQNPLNVQYLLLPNSSIKPTNMKAEISSSSESRSFHLTPRLDPKTLFYRNGLVEMGDIAPTAALTVNLSRPSTKELPRTKRSKRQQRRRAAKHHKRQYSQIENAMAEAITPGPDPKET